MAVFQQQQSQALTLVAMTCSTIIIIKRAELTLTATSVSHVAFLLLDSNVVNAVMLKYL